MNDVSDHATLDTRHGRAACRECGGLLAVAYKPERPGQTGAVGPIGAKMLPGPAPDVEQVLCASCGTVLYEG